MKLKNKKKYIFLIILFLASVIFYNFRYEIVFNSFSKFGYGKVQAQRYTFLILERPFKIIERKFRANFLKNKELKETLENSLKIKSGFNSYSSKNIEFVDGNYFLNIFKPIYNKTESIEKLQYSNMWKNKMPLKIWTVDMSNVKSGEKSIGNKKKFLKVQATPKICGTKLIYAKQDGNIGAIDFRTGTRFWHKKYGDADSISIRGFFCEYDKNLDTFVILLPTGAGIFCINSSDGSLIESRCKNGRLGSFESRVMPHLLNDKVYVATINPSGIEAYNFYNGKLLWRTDFETGRFFLEQGSNPWSNFTIDEENQLIFINTGSPSSKFKFENAEKYKYSGSLLALNLKNGKIVWQFQEHSKDSLNHDFVGKPILSPRKIDGKDIVITLSKSGSIYFINRKNGLPALPIKENIIDFGDFKYSYKKSVLPRSLLDSNYYNFLGKDCKNCNFNTKIFGPFPPILKLERIFDGHDGGPQWPGASLDMFNNYLILTSSHNIIYKLYVDFIPKPLSSLPKNSLVKQCTSCHDSQGRVKGFSSENTTIIPSLFLTSQIYNISLLDSYLKNNYFHKKLNFNNEELNNIYKDLQEYDLKIINNNEYQFFEVTRAIDITNKDIYSRSGPFGKITAISLDTGETIWQIPAGTYKLNDTETIIGSKVYGAITDGKNNEGISFFTGSFDKKLYAVNNKDGMYLWNHDLPASGSALPLVYNIDNERWIFVVATGGRVVNDESDSIVAFRQKLD